MLYGHELVKLPTPKFYVLYNGKDELKETVLRLSSAFEIEGGELELVVYVIDINYERGHAVLDKSPSLKGYSYLIAKIRDFRDSGLSRDEAIAKAVRACITEGVLADFLTDKNFKEVCDMLSFEYRIEDELAVRNKQERAEGKAEGILESAMRLINKGKSLQEVTDLLDLSEEQTKQLHVLA